jgi:large subunit ribosomal protein L32
MRRSHQHRAFTPIQSVRCPNCGQPKLPHASCGDCGYVRPGLTLKVGKEK